MMKVLVCLAAALAVVYGARCPAPATSSYSFGVFGDMPYYFSDTIMNKYLTPTKNYKRDPFVRNVVDSMNGAGLSFLAFTGDTKSGKTSCANIVDDTWFKLITTSFNAPLVYSVGDNEWTDCHRNTGAPTNPLDRLAYLRSKFFKGKTLGGACSIETPSQIVKGYPENVRFNYGKITVAAVHVVGSNNNVAAPLTAEGAADESCADWFSTDAQATGKPASTSAAYNCQKNSFRSCQECIDATNEFIARDAAGIAFMKTRDCIDAINKFIARDAAGIAFLKTASGGCGAVHECHHPQTFASAKARGSRGVVIVIQADMTSPDPTALTYGTLAYPYPSVAGGQYATDGYENFATALYEEASAFPGQVLLLHGDSHVFVHETNSMGLPNLQRVMNPGETQFNWVKVTVNEAAGCTCNAYEGTFSVEEVIANAGPHTESCDPIKGC
ncbi:hypothetical protein JKP88DRAFT_252373 [Tribonema minus]|uniref:Uncharacterized protein n=1 Tax=Tribonema minus TaxID=303371 RepID=A0A836CM04_9STRA|nr:hypothetical protein JKP88DRAFT_252373 [Tribonema minus]